MNGTLQELTNLYIYQKDGKPICHVNFKGRVESYAVVQVDELLGDVLELCIKNIDNISREQVIWEGDIGYITGTDGKRYLDVAENIVYCNEYEEYNELYEDIFDSDTEESEEAWYGKENIIEQIIKMFEVIGERNAKFTAKVLQNFMYKHVRYVPPCEKRHDYRECIYKDEDSKEEISFMFCEDKQSIEEELLGDDQEYCIYNYECDNMQEILMALIHYISMKNYNIRKCENCGRYFIAYNRSDEKYCYRKIKGEDSCKEYMRKQKRRIRMSKEPVAKKYYSVYTNLSNRVNAAKYRGREDEIYSLINSLQTGYREKKNTLTEDEMIAWLNTFLVRKGEKKK